MRGLVGLLLVGSLGLALVADAQDAGGSQAALAEEARLADWSDRARSFLIKAEDASARLEAGRRAYKRARQGQDVQGGDRLALMTEVARAEADLHEARAGFERLREEARREGAPPGFVRELEDAAVAEDVTLLLATEAETQDQHSTVARNLRARATRYRAMAERHRELGAEYAEGGRRSQRAHCERLADLEEKMADQYKRLAEGHEQHED